MTNDEEKKETERAREILRNMPSLDHLPRLSDMLPDEDEEPDLPTFCACDDFREAMQPGTDNEGYSRAIRCRRGRWQIGFGLPPISFCPWCGLGVPEVER